MQASVCITTSPSSLVKPASHNLFLGQSFSSSRQCLPLRRRAFSSITRALLSTSKELVLREFHERKALKIISGLQNFDKENVASVVTAADKGGATHVDIACDPELVKLAIGLTSLPVCVSSVDPAAFPAAVEAGARMVCQQLVSLLLN